MIYETYWSRRRLVPDPSHTTSLSERLIPVASFAGLVLIALAILTTVALVQDNLAPIETSPQSLVKVRSTTPFLIESRVHALSAIVRPADNHSYEVIFADAKRYVLPAERDAMRNMLNHKASQLIESAVLVMSEIPGSNRIQLWPDASLKPDLLDELMSDFTAAGFDDFDIAVSVEETK